ncbi:MAG: hypothetical protein H7Z41_06385 [Cytophagales bacterium]|nr:hypothetical protein [Armatimonadota bacterium]
MRCFLLLLTLLATGIPLALPAAAVPAKPAEESLYTNATRLLIKGRRFDQASQLLEIARKRDPADPRIPLALGCAYASRAASFSYAAGFRRNLVEMRSEYPAAFEKWKTAQDDPKSKGYGEPAPRPPPLGPIWTKDDNRPLKMADQEVNERVRQLARNAGSAWDVAEKMARTDVERAEVRLTRAWGLWTLAVYNRSLGLDAWGEKADPAVDRFALRGLNPALPYGKTILAAFTEATKLAPNNADHWRSLGDARKAAEDHDGAEAALLRSLEVLPRQPALWYRLYEQAAERMREHRENPGTPDRLRDSEGKAFEYLENAARYDPSNAFPRYLLAGLTLKRAKLDSSPFLPLTRTTAPTQAQQDIAVAASKRGAARQAVQEAVALIEQGNSLPTCTLRVYRHAPPPLLVAAWNLNRENPLGQGDYSASLREMTRTVGGFAVVQAGEGDTIEGERSARALQDMGQRIAGGPVSAASESTENPLMFTGEALIGMGYQMLSGVRRAAGDAEGAAALRETYEAYNEAFLRRLQAILDAPPPSLLDSY